MQFLFDCLIWATLFSLLLASLLLLVLPPAPTSASATSASSGVETHIVWKLIYAVKTSMEAITALLFTLLVYLSVLAFNLFSTAATLVDAKLSTYSFLFQSRISVDFGVKVITGDWRNSLSHLHNLGYTIDDKFEARSTTDKKTARTVEDFYTSHCTSNPDSLIQQLPPTRFSSQTAAFTADGGAKWTRELVKDVMSGAELAKTSQEGKTADAILQLRWAAEKEIKDRLQQKTKPFFASAEEPFVFLPVEAVAVLKKYPNWPPHQDRLGIVEVFSSLLALQAQGVSFDFSAASSGTTSNGTRIEDYLGKAHPLSLFERYKQRFFHLPPSPRAALVVSWVASETQRGMLGKVKAGLR